MYLTWKQDEYTGGYVKHLLDVERVMATAVPKMVEYYEKTGQFAAAAKFRMMAGAR